MIVNCRCGRRMTPHVTQRVRHYRCACGRQVRITQVAAYGCVAIRRSGDACGRDAVVSVPVELCLRHLEKLLSSDHPMIDRALRNVVTTRQVERKRAADQEAQRHEAWKVERQQRDVVRRRLKQRLASLPVDAVLATEPGDEELESARHREFVDLRAIRNEYFWPNDRLLDHIEAVRREHGDPVITSYPDPSS